ncbi:MAG: thiopurine S-methyltransferase [Gammaproteobacteria bacterium]|nr:thiopurine S-methyltransferase [Gammaproteobacteria bacterium]
MDPSFWLARWEANEIGFHQPDINPYLPRYWPRLQAPHAGRVFVPLCGKSRDMLWLTGEGYRVIGVEISPIAVQAFFAESDLQPQVDADDRFRVHRTAEITLLEGDFFDLRQADLGHPVAVYDRASLIALPPEMRQRYARQLAALLLPGTPVLLITLDYPQAEMDGPPFAVTSAEVAELYAAHFSIAALPGQDILAESPGFKARGLTRLTEQAYQLVRR